MIQRLLRGQPITTGLKPAILVDVLGTQVTTRDIVVHILSAPTGVAASDGTYTDKVSVTWNASSGATRYEVYRNASNTHTGETLLTSTQTSSPFDDTTAVAGTTYYYWVKAGNSSGCSGYSSNDTGYRAISAPSGVSASDGIYPDKVTVAWNASSGATYYQVFRNTTDSHSGETQLVGDQSTVPLMTSLLSRGPTIITG